MKDVIQVFEPECSEKEMNLLGMEVEYSGHAGFELAEIQTYIKVVIKARK